MGDGILHKLRNSNLQIDAKSVKGYMAMALLRDLSTHLQKGTFYFYTSLQFEPTMFFALVTLSWLVLCSLWWVAALTIGIPLTLMLMVSKTFRSSFFSWFFVYIIGPIFQPRTIPARKRAFQILKECVANRNKAVPLEVLEIGVGEGPNLQFYPENCNLTVLDKNKFFESYYQKNAKKFAHISYQRTVIQPAENMSNIADNSLDVVVSTYLHCSCDDTYAVLKEVQRVLKPGGKYVFLEHVCYPQNEVGLSIQRLINPIWFLFFNGCTLDRDTAAKIKRAGFSDVICDKYISTYWWMYLVRHQIVGVATK
ncbi:methyltransferase-like protein 7B [Nephila pilipes]|uniref:Methyltransferase-like protein 7B n=1 Tax=Nephila pilipes TaxID=299642 RepID=A0A8X6R038_NEPPI|nr:methyltransferase-like protein 7B [Nephila pilipes]